MYFGQSSDWGFGLLYVIAGLGWKWKKAVGIDFSLAAKEKETEKILNSFGVKNKTAINYSNSDTIDSWYKRLISVTVDRWLYGLSVGLLPKILVTERSHHQ